MSKPPSPNSAATNAQKFFRKAEQNDALAKRAGKTERAVAAAKTAKLRGLRLAKEQADREEAERLVAAEAAGPAAPPRPARRRAAPKAKPAAMLRMIY